MIPKNKELLWILVGGGKHTYRWFYPKPHKILISLSSNQRLGIVENWLSSGKLLRKSLKAVGIKDNEEKINRYIV